MRFRWLPFRARPVHRMRMAVQAALLQASRLLKVDQAVVKCMVKFLAKVHVIPRKTAAMMQRLNENSQSYIQAEEEELLTLNWHCVGQKPT